MSYYSLCTLYGAMVGLSLGLTGGGGAIFAVPLLVYGLGLSAREAVGVSLAAVGLTALVGFFNRWRLGEVETRPGLLFAIAGALGSPIGAWISRLLPEMALLLLFALLMLVVAVRMWRQGSQNMVHEKSMVHENCAKDSLDAPTCQRDANGSLILTSRCAMLLFLLGIGTGLMSGLFGVGGGLVIVPALVLFSGMSMQPAIGTSLMVITLVSITAIVSRIASGQTLPLAVTGVFALGGIVGMFFGQSVGRRLPSALPQKVFAIAILATAVFVIVRSLGGRY